MLILAQLRKPSSSLEGASSEHCLNDVLPRLHLRSQDRNPQTLCVPQTDHGRDGKSVPSKLSAFWGSLVQAKCDPNGKANPGRKSKHSRHPLSKKNTHAEVSTTSMPHVSGVPIGSGRLPIEPMRKTPSNQVVDPPTAKWVSGAAHVSWQGASFLLSRWGISFSKTSDNFENADHVCACVSMSA